VSNKSERISHLVPAATPGGPDPHYAGYFDHFNRGLFYEAHDVLEQLWLKDRHGPNGAFYKGLIQLAGAFVHLKKERLRPAAALFKLAEANLAKYPATHEDLSVATVLALIHHWLASLEKSNYNTNPLHTESHPVLRLLSVPQ
jgi:predicted metal-dependent hydrolase